MLAPADETMALYCAWKNAAECSLAFFLNSSKLAARCSPDALAKLPRCSLRRDGLLAASAAATDGREDKLCAMEDMRAAEGLANLTPGRFPEVVGTLP